MLQDASQNMTLTLPWASSVRPTQGQGRMISEGYSQDDIKNGFRTDVVSPRNALGDRVKMVGATALSIIIPLAFAIIFLLTTVTWFSFTWESIFAMQGSELSPVLVFILGDIFLALFLFAFVRRLLMIRRSSKSYLEVTESDQPELHAFVNHLAQMLRGPKPRAVKLDAEVGLVLRPASLKDAITGAGPEVVIGLPLLYGLSARQLSGVIAHAYAGYSREATLHGYPILCTIDRWLFAQTGLGRSAQLDRGDLKAGSTLWLDQFLKPLDVMVQGTFYFMYRIVSAMTFEVSRKVDMAGDISSARIAGSTEFRSTQFRLRSLHYGQLNANQELTNSWRSKKLSDNFPALVVDHADTLQLSLRPRLIQEMEELVTPLTRSRIVDLGRIVNVEHTQEEGACFLLGAAISLLRTPLEISQRVTRSYYRYIGLKTPDLYSTQKSQALHREEKERSKRREAFRGLECSGRIIRIDDFEVYALKSISDRVHRYTEISNKFVDNEELITDIAEAVKNFELRKSMLHTRRVLEECKGARTPMLKDLEIQWLGLIKDQSDQKTLLAPFESLFSKRSALALSLALDTPKVQRDLQMSRNEMQSHFLRLVDALNFLVRSAESYGRLKTYTQTLGQLLVESANKQRSAYLLGEMTNRYQRYLQIELVALMKVLSGVAYPLGSVSVTYKAGKSSAGIGSEMLTIGDVIQNDVADIELASSCPEACHRVTNSVCQYLESFNEQLQKRIAFIVGIVESSLQEELDSIPK